MPVVHLLWEQTDRVQFSAARTQQSGVRDAVLRLRAIRRELKDAAMFESFENGEPGSRVLSGLRILGAIQLATRDQSGRPDDYGK